MTLPLDLRRWWNRVDVRARSVVSFPEFTTPGEALRLWRDQCGPRSLLDVAHQGWSLMPIELTQGQSAGGRLFEYYLGDGEYVLRWERLVDWLAYVARLVDAGEFDRTPSGLRVRSRDQFVATEAYEPEPAQPLERPDAIRADRPELWPSHWRAF